MKKLIIFTIFSFLSLALFAKSKGYMLRDNGALRVDNGKGGVEYSTDVPAGTELEVLSDEPVVFDLVTKSETYPKLKFYQVSYEKKTYYVRESEMALGSQLSVILDDTTIFTKPQISSFINAVLERGTLVVVGSQTKSIGAYTFTEVQYYSTSASVVRTRYILNDKISTNKNDVTAVKIVDKVSSISNSDKVKEKAMKMELFNNAMKLDTSYQISDYISEEYQKQIGD